MLPPSTRRYPHGNDLTCAKLLWGVLMITVAVWVYSEVVIFRAGKDLTEQTEVPLESKDSSVRIPFLDLCEDRLGKGVDSSGEPIVGTEIPIHGKLATYFNGREAHTELEKEEIHFGRDPSITKVLREGDPGGTGVAHRFHCWRFQTPLTFEMSEHALPNSREIGGLHSDDRLVMYYDVFIGKGVPNSRKKGQWEDLDEKIKRPHDLGGLSTRFALEKNYNEEWSVGKETLSGVLIGRGCKRAFRLTGSEARYRWHTSFWRFFGARSYAREVWIFNTVGLENDQHCRKLKPGEGPGEEEYGYALRFRVQLQTSQVLGVDFRDNTFGRGAAAISSVVAMLGILKILELLFRRVEDDAREAPLTFRFKVPSFGLGMGGADESERAPLVDKD